MKLKSLRVLLWLALCVLPLSACADASDADTLRKLTALAEQGSAAAQYNVGMFHNNGIGTAKDPRTAFRWFERAAAEAGYSLAQGDVGNIYGKRSDWPQAVKWWAAAAEQGYAPAAYNLANAYQRGQGVPKDQVKALGNMLIVARLTPEPMRPRLAPSLEAIRGTLSPEQITQAESAAAAWQANPSSLTLRAKRGVVEAKELIQ